MFETFDHTADVGIRVRAATLEAIFEEAASALFCVMVADTDKIRPESCYKFRITGSQRDDLLLDWLNELLFAFSTQHVLLKAFKVTFDDEGLCATCWGEQFDPSVHDLAEEVKAITYHGLKVEQLGTSWLAEVILDL